MPITLSITSVKYFQPINLQLNVITKVYIGPNGSLGSSVSMGPDNRSNWANKVTSSLTQ